MNDRVRMYSEVLGVLCLHDSVRQGLDSIHNAKGRRCKLSPVIMQFIGSYISKISTKFIVRSKVSSLLRLILCAPNEEMSEHKEIEFDKRVSTRFRADLIDNAVYLCKALGVSVLSRSNAHDGFVGRSSLIIDDGFVWVGLDL